MNKFSSGRELPEYVFAEKFDSFMLFDFSSLIYEFDTLLIENLKMVVINYEKGIDFLLIHIWIIIMTVFCGTITLYAK
jgi:hypothetical protein